MKNLISSKFIIIPKMGSNAITSINIAQLEGIKRARVIY